VAACSRCPKACARRKRHEVKRARRQRRSEGRSNSSTFVCLRVRLLWFAGVWRYEEKWKIMVAARVAAASAAQVAGHHSDADLERARSIIGAGECLIAVWKATPMQAATASCFPFSPLLWFPCFLPVALQAAPAVVACFWSNKWQLEDSLTILTDKKFYRDVKDGCCQCMTNTGFAGSVALHQIRAVDEGAAPGQWLAPCCTALSVVTLTLPYRHRLTNCGQNGDEKLQFICDDTEATAKLIRASMRAVDTHTSPGMVPTPVDQHANPIAEQFVSIPVMPVVQAVEMYPHTHTHTLGPAPAVMARDTDIAGQITTLHQLRESGGLTQAEYEAAMAKLLN
jgi:hypothetical protein